MIAGASRRGVFHGADPPRMSTSTLRFPVAVTFRRMPLANRWVSERWEPVAVEWESAPAPSAPVRAGDGPTDPGWRFGGQSLELHQSEAEGYYLNITSPEPKVFVMWRMADAGVVPPILPVVVTVSYNQAARMVDGGEQVDAVPLPADILELMKPYVAENYRPEARSKVRRNDPFRDDAERQQRGPRR
jgi:hypothetical protein